MADGHLSIYLSDHFAGGVAALELLDDLEQAHTGTAIAQVAASLHEDVKADHQELDALIRRAGMNASRASQATAWLIEKVAELKVRVDDPVDGTLRLLETLKVLALGSEGKRALWECLAFVAGDVTALQGLDYARLIERARDQRRQVEALRLDAARAAFTGGP